MGDCTTELPKEVGVKASQRFEDLKLIHRSQAGDTEAFGELVTKYRSKIFNMIYGIVGNENDAWDLAQEGFLKAWRSIHRFQARSSFYTWLYSITINVTIDSLRQRCRRSEVELDDAIPSSLPSPRANYQRNEIRQHINAALAQLSPEHRAVIVLKGDRRPSLSRDCRNSESLDRDSHVPAFLRQEETAIHFKTPFQTG
jgi:RNA polymerase sigma factor (sigma-70 family)